MTNETLHPRKAPRQARSTATVEVILEAATRVLTEESLSGFNTNRIAQVAGVSVGSFYQYFPNKAALVATLIERAQAALADAVDGCIAQSRDKPLAKVLAELTDIAIDHQFRNPVFAAALDHEERRLPLDAVLRDAQERLINSIQTLLNDHHQDFRAPLPTSAAIDCLLIAKALVESEASRPTPAIDALRERVVRALLGYLVPPG